MKAALLGCLLSTGLMAQADDYHWTKPQIALEVLSEASLAVDWGQTLDLSRRSQNDPRLTEDNLFLGNRPHRATVNLWFIGWLIAHPFIANLLPGRVRTVFQCITIGFEGNCISHNTCIGLRIRF